MVTISVIFIMRLLVIDISFDPIWYTGSVAAQIAGSYNFGRVSILIVLGLTLFLGLVVVVKIINHSKGALRSFMCCLKVLK